MLQAKDRRKIKLKNVREVYRNVSKFVHVHKRMGFYSVTTFNCGFESRFVQWLNKYETIMKQNTQTNEL